MRTIKVLALAFFCAQPVATLAATFSIDSSQSYVSIETPAWQRGLPWGFILPGDGQVTVEGYDWILVSETRQFGLAGGLAVTPSDTWVGFQVELDSTFLVSSAPVEIGFQLPRFVSADSSHSELRWSNSCTGFSSNTSFLFYRSCQTPLRYEELVGSLSGGGLTIDGKSPGFRLFGVTVFGGLEAPPIPEYSLADLGYTYHIVASIPEPSGALMMTAGLAAMLLRRVRRERVLSKSYNN